MPVYSDPGVYILITDAAGHLRRFLPRKHFQAFTAQKTADNGYDTFQLDLSAEVTDLDNIQFRDQVELWFGCVLQYRGFVQEKHRALPTSENDPPTLTLAGNGVSFEAGLQDVDGDLQLPLNTDIAEAWRRAFERTVFPSLPGLVAQAVPVGVTLQKQEGTYKLFKDVAQSLVSGVADGMAVTGGDADAEGNNRLFLRPYSDKQDWAVVVPGGKGTAAEARDNSRDVRNRIRLFGGATRWPNLFPNPTFARLVFSDLGHANLLSDHSFEAAPSGGIGSLSAAWTGGGSPAVMSASSGLGGAARVGTQALTLNTVGQSASQTVSVTGGDTYTFTVHARREALDVAGAAQVSVDWGSRTDTVDVTPADLGFSYWGATVAAPAGATSATLTVTCTSGSGAGTGVVVDDLMLADVSGAVADGWVLNTFGTAKVVSQNWLYDLDAYRGSRCLHVQVTATDADNEDAHLEMGTGAPPSAYHAYAERRLPITAGESLRLYVPVKSPPGVTSNGRMLLEIHYYTAGGYDTGVRTKVEVPAGPGFPEWTMLTAGATGPTTGNGLIGLLSMAHGGVTPAGGAYAGAFLTFREDTDLLIGGMCLRDASAPPDEFVGEGAYVPLLDCTDPGLKDTDHGGAMPVGQGITDAAAASQATYGVRCEPLTDANITCRADARALAVAYFNANAIAYPQPSVTVVNDARPFFPGEGVTLVGEAGKALMAGAPVGTDGRPYLPIAQVRLQVDDTGNFLQTVDLQEAKLDAYRRIYKASRKAAQAGGSAQVYTGVGAGGAASGGVSGGLAPPLIVTDGTTPVEGVAVLKLTRGVLSAPEDGEADWFPQDADATHKGVLELNTDLGGTAAAPEVVGIRTIPVTSAPPADGQGLVFRAGGADIEWGDVGGDAIIPVAALPPPGPDTETHFYRLTTFSGGGAVGGDASGGSSSGGSGNASKEWDWPTDLQGFADAGYGGADPLPLSWVAADAGLGAGCLGWALSGTPAAGTVGDVATLSGTWESWGVPAGATVTAVRLSGFNYRVAAHAGLSSWSLSVGLTPHGQPALPALATLEDTSFPSAWSAFPTETWVAVPASARAPSTALDLTLTVSAALAGGSTDVDLRLDTLRLDFEYTGAETFDPALYTLNGDAALVGGEIQLTGGQTQFGSAFLTAAESVASFSKSFWIRSELGTGLGGGWADGFMWTVQADPAGPHALGNTTIGLGGDLAWQGITKSVGVKFDKFRNTHATDPLSFTQPDDPSDNCTGLFLDGEVPQGGADLTPTGLSLRTANRLHVTADYDGATLTVAVTDGGTGASATASYAVDIPGTLGAPTGYFGWTAATDEEWSSQFLTTPGTGSGGTLTGGGAGPGGPAHETVWYSEKLADGTYRWVQVPDGDTASGAGATPGSVTVPAPTLPGQILFSLDGATAQWVLPLTDPDVGWMTTDDGEMMVTT